MAFELKCFCMTCTYSREYSCPQGIENTDAKVLTQAVIYREWLPFLSWLPINHFNSCFSIFAYPYRLSFFALILFFHSLPCEYSHSNAKLLWSTAKIEVAKKKKKKPQQTPNKESTKNLPNNLITDMLNLVSFELGIEWIGQWPVIVWIIMLCLWVDH